MAGDTQRAASQASHFLPDDRAEHFWDPWKFGSRLYAQEFGIPENQAWDLFVFYKPYLAWRDRLPEPTFWMQARGLNVGERYSEGALEKALQPWLDN